MCSPLANTAGVLFAAVRVKVRAVDLERVESRDIMGRTRKTVRSMPCASRLVCHFVAPSSCITCIHVTPYITRKSGSEKWREIVANNKQVLLPTPP